MISRKLQRVSLVLILVLTFLYNFSKNVDVLTREFDRETPNVVNSLQKDPLPKDGAAPKQNNANHIGKELVPFSFERKSLVEIINFLAQKRQINILLPQLAADLDTINKQLITFVPEGTNSIPLDEAWSLLTMFLELSGFSIFPKRPQLFEIVRTGKAGEAGISNEPLPLYVGTPPNKLPHSEQRIRYIYYLKNLKVPTAEDKDTNPLGRIFRDMLSPGAPVIPEPKSNGFIVIDKSNVIASIITIISALDGTGFTEAIDVIPIYNVPARDIVRVLESLKKAAGEAAGGPSLRSGQGEIAYLTGDTKIVSDDRSNSLILMGRQTSIERISDFVHEHMDVPQESGKSILHTYDLQYLDAPTFAPVLQSLLTPVPGSQATQGPPGGPERAFQGIAVAFEEVKTIEARLPVQEAAIEQTEGVEVPVGLEGKIVTGGNRLIIGAIQEDWERVRELIQELDRPQPQVILEVLICDFIGTKTRAIASTFRNPTNDVFQPSLGAQFLSSQVSPVINALGPNPNQLAQDLLGLIFVPNTAPLPIPQFLSQGGPGTMLISFKDIGGSGIMGLLALLDSQVDSKVLTHPFLVTTNNQRATITSQLIKRDRGPAVPSAAGVTTIVIVDVPATIQVQMIPRLSSLERMNLQIAVDINMFLSPSSSSLTRETRRVNTSANLGSGDVLVIGGLTRIDVSDVVTETPFLSQIPLIGWLFKSVTKLVTKTNIAIFISPTIVQPKLRGGLNLYTADKLRKTRRDIDDELVIGSNRDPITRVFFNSGEKSEHLVRHFLSDVDNPPGADLIKTTREIRREKRRPKRKPLTVKSTDPVQGAVREIIA